jgi:mannose-6-phosphate isomerase-like protein (cupin superfamily)
MIIEHIDKMTKGWFIGNFVPSVFVTEAFEVGFKIHKAGEKYGFHYHQLVKEINLLVEGEMKMHKKSLKSGDIFILEPFEIADPEFLTDCKIICVKVPGIAQDKIDI